MLRVWRLLSLLFLASVFLRRRGGGAGRDSEKPPFEQSPDIPHHLFLKLFGFREPVEEVSGLLSVSPDEIDDVYAPPTAAPAVDLPDERDRVSRGRSKMAGIFYIICDYFFVGIAMASNTKFIVMGLTSILPGIYI
ncbi:hypothetical protein GQX73_g6641 [Xylaria multiplex]|uniref:Uncharacterized protein n=1 Tax=Xylaria multiplex TaxID=323545 RepID=A0A7C8MS29_9PEZI|nr:hypothetical protein GQX73_g6641 [Xylaria multiplex]